MIPFSQLYSKYVNINRFKILEDKEIDDKENQHNEHEDSISHSAGQPQNSNSVQSQVIVKKSTSSKPEAPTTVILGDSIVKNVCGNIIIESVKHQKHVVVKPFSGAKVADINHYKKPKQEKSPADIIIHVGTNDLSSDKEIMQLTKSVKTAANKVAVSSIPPRKDKGKS